jgi:hypothetical protein
MRTHGSILSANSAPPPLTPPHKGEGDFAAAPRRINADNLGRNDNVGVSLPLVGVRRTGETRGSPRQGQGWGCAAEDNCPAAYEEKRSLNGATP